MPFPTGPQAPVLSHCGQARSGEGDTGHLASETPTVRPRHLPDNREVTCKDASTPNPTPKCWWPGYHPLGRRHTEAALGNVTCSGETRTNANIYSQVPQADTQSDHPTAWTRSQRAARTASDSRRQLDEHPLMENWTFFFCNKLILCCTSQSQSIMGLQWRTHTKGIKYQFPSTTCKVLPFRDHRPFLSPASGKQQLRDGTESGSHRPEPARFRHFAPV